jgi:acyl carrier protein
MEATPSPAPIPALARFPTEVLEAYERYRSKGDAGAVQEVVIAAVIDYRPSGSGPPQTVGDTTLLIEDLGYDSVAVAELVFFLEDIFDLTISNEDILAVRAIGDLRSCVTRKLAAKQNGA